MSVQGWAGGLQQQQPGATDGCVPAADDDIHWRCWCCANTHHKPQNGEAAAIRKVKVLSWTGLVSFFFSCFKWFFNGSDYACGFSAWPTFGMAAMKYTW
jgi:hypothetical protein